jgi:hypothetical protein
VAGVEIVNVGLGQVGPESFRGPGHPQAGFRRPWRASANTSSRR